MSSVKTFLKINKWNERILVKQNRTRRACRGSWQVAEVCEAATEGQWFIYLFLSKLIFKTQLNALHWVHHKTVSRLTWACFVIWLSWSLRTLRRILTGGASSLYTSNTRVSAGNHLQHWNTGPPVEGCHRSGDFLFVFYFSSTEKRATMSSWI